MSFFVYDLTFLIIFSIFIFIFLYKRKKNLKREGVVYLYRTKLGIKLINYIGEKYSKFLNIAKYFVVAFGYLAMASMIYLLIKTVEIFYQYPSVVDAVKIPPLAPLIPYLPQLFKADYLPVFYFTYWIIVLAVVAIVHEFAHGIFAKLNNITIKSTGFAFLGPFLGAFVEPDEKQMNKAKKVDQLAMLASGTFANAVFTVIFFVMLWLFFSMAYAQSGYIFNTYSFKYIEKTNITGIDGNISLSLDLGNLNLTEIYAGNQTYFIATSMIGKLNSLNSPKIIPVYEDTSALRNGLNGAIIAINNQSIKNRNDLAVLLGKYKPGQEITVKTVNSKNEEKNYKIILGKNPNNETQSYLGIGNLVGSSTSIFGKLRTSFIFFKDSSTYYTPKYVPDFTDFIYYLLWWLAFINFSVALANMLPAGIFDGGKFFYISVLGLTKSEKLSKLIFKISTYLILAVFALLMVLWGFSYL